MTDEEYGDKLKQFILSTVDYGKYAKELHVKEGRVLLTALDIRGQLSYKKTSAKGLYLDVANLLEEMAEHVRENSPWRGFNQLVGEPEDR